MAFDILVDPDLELCRLYHVKVTNLLFFRLIERVTYVIGQDGRVLQVIRATKPRDHASKALCAI